MQHSTNNNSAPQHANLSEIQSHKLLFSTLRAKGGEGSEVFFVFFFVFKLQVAGISATTGHLYFTICVLE